MGNFSESYGNNSTTYEGFEPYERCGNYDYLINCLNIYVTPVIIVFGLAGNLLSAIIFLATSLKKRSSSVYLAMLSMADFGYLFVLLLARLDYEDIVHLYCVDILCQIWAYLGLTCSTFSVWLIVAFTIERFVAVRFPLQNPYGCTVTRARIITSCILVLSMLSQIYAFWTSGLLETRDGFVCEMIPEYEYAMEIINYVDTVFALILPLFVIITLNVLIARSLFTFRSRLFFKEDNEENWDVERSFRGNTSITTVDKVGIHIKLSSLESKSGTFSDLSKQHVRINIAQYGRNLLMAKGQRNVTKMLLIISTVFVLLNVPSYCVRLYIFAAQTVFGLTISPAVWCVQQVVMLLFNLNYCVNFILYSMCAGTFRKAMMIFVKMKYHRFKRYGTNLRKPNHM